MMNYRLTPAGMAVIQQSTNNRYWSGCGEKGVLLQCRGDVTETARIENSMEFPQIIKQQNHYTTQQFHFRVQAEGEWGETEAPGLGRAEWGSGVGGEGCGGDRGTRAGEG